MCCVRKCRYSNFTVGWWYCPFAIFPLLACQSNWVNKRNRLVMLITYFHFICRCRARRLCPRCRPKRIRILRLPSGFPDDPLSWRWYRLRHGNPSYLKDPWGIPRQNHEHLLSRPISQSLGHRCWALQCYPLSPPVGWEHRRDLLHRQRGSLRHLLPHTEVDHPNLWRLESSGLLDDVGSYHLPSLPWPAQCWSPKACSQHGSLPPSSFLHARICPTHLQG